MKTLDSGIQINAPVFYTDLPMSKTNLAKTLEVARSTVWLWAELAYMRVEDFRKAYPTVEGKVIKTAPLSPYQCWVVNEIGRIFKLLGNDKLVRAYVSENSKDFSILKFKSLVSKISY